MHDEPVDDTVCDDTVGDDTVGDDTVGNDTVGDDTVGEVGEQVILDNNSQKCNFIESYIGKIGAKIVNCGITKSPILITAQENR